MSFFAASLILPFVALCGFFGYNWVLIEQERSAARLKAVADTLTGEVDRFLGDRLAVLHSLASSPALDQDDFVRFERQARDVFDQSGLGTILREPSGQVRVETLGDSIPRRQSAALPLVQGVEGSEISDLLIRDGGQGSIVALTVPVVRNGQVRFVLNAVVRPVAFNDILRRSGLSEEQFGTVADRRGRVIGRSASSPMKVGEVVQGFEDRVGEHGVWSGTDGLGRPIRVGYRRLDTGWLVNVGMTQSAFRAPLIRSFQILAGLTLALVVGAVLLTLPIVRRMLKDRHKLEETTELFCLAQEAATAGVWDWNVRTDRISLSPISARMHGLPVSAGTEDGPVVLPLADWMACIVSQDLPGVWQAVMQNRATSTTNIAEYRTHSGKDGAGHRWIQSIGRAVFDAGGGKPTRFVGLHFDVTARREAEEELRASEARLRTSEARLALALDSGEDGLFDWDLVNDETWVSDGWLAKVGAYREGQSRSGKAYVETIHPDDRDAVSKGLQAHLAGISPSFEAEYRRRRADGGYFWVLNRARVVSRDANGLALRLVGTLIDISHRKQAEIRIEHMALHDALTDLPNRRAFRSHLDRVLERAKLSTNHQAVLSCDLDRFKAVNDTLGHVMGDRLLCLVAERIRVVVRENDVVARLGGDEFAVILDDIDEEKVEQVSKRIIAALGEPILLDGIPVHIGISIGAALVSDGGASAEEIFQRADNALYQAKAAGRNTYQLFEAEAHARTATRSLLALDMREAIRRGDFFLVYQPIIDVTTNAVVSFEALMRWRHPVHGLISPADFIPVAEETGLIVPLGAWALIEACREATGWPEHLRVGVNVSAVQFRCGLEEAVLTALASTGLKAHRLKLEVTESLLVQNPDQAVATLHRLRGMGVKIALDDFGTGYSSLSYLRKFPFDKLKIDRAFIRDIADPDAAAIVRAVVGIGERLGMGIVAEGVETQEQLDLVRREGCTEVQGFLFSKPLPAAEALAFVTDHTARAAA